MEIRELQLGDIFSVIKICKKVNIKPFIKQFTSVDTTNKSKEERVKIQYDVGFDFFMYLIENIGDAENEIYKLIGEMCNRKIDEVKKFTLTDIIAFYDGLIKANSTDKIKDFFKQAMGSMMK